MLRFFGSIINNVKETFKSDVVYFEIYNIVLLIMLMILFMVCVYLEIAYGMLRRKLNEINDFVLRARSLGKLYNDKPFDPILFERLLLEALEVLRSNVHIITQPYFYSTSLDNILSSVPGYVKVLAFAKYVYKHQDTKNNAVHKVMVKHYGPKYPTSPAILYDITIQMTPTYQRNYKHSILVDLTKSQYIYKKNIIKANSLVDSETKKKI